MTQGFLEVMKRNSIKLPRVYDGLSDAVSTRHSHAVSEFPLYSPVVSQSIFWRPRFAINSRLIDQVPYLFWILEGIRPESIVQIGLGDGQVHMAACQAVEKMAVSCSVLGIELDDVSDASLYKARHDADYGDFSKIISSSAPDIQSYLPSNLDVLVVNLSSSAEVTDDLFKACLNRLSDRAVVLVCHPEQRLSEDCEVARYLRQNTARVIEGPFSPSQGKLSVVLHGEYQPDRLLALAEGTADSPIRMIARQVFHRLGQGLKDSMELGQLRLEHGRELQDLRRSRNESAQLREALNEAEERVSLAEQEMNAAFEKLSAAHSADIGRIAGLRAEKTELAERSLRLQEAHDALKKKCDESEAELRSLKTRLENSERERKKAVESAQGVERDYVERIGDLSAQIADLKKKLAASEQAVKASVDSAREAERGYVERLGEATAQLVDLKQRLLANEQARKSQAEIVQNAERSHAEQMGEMTAQLAELKQRLAASEQAQKKAVEEGLKAKSTADELHVKTAGLEKQLEMTKSELNAVKEKAEKTQKELKSEIDQLLTSTSWRATQPLRRVKTIFSGDAGKDR